MEKWNYTIIYVMPKGSRLGLYEVLDENELEKMVKKLQDNGCTIETIEKAELTESA